MSFQPSAVPAAITASLRAPNASRADLRSAASSIDLAAFTIAVPSAPIRVPCSPIAAAAGLIPSSLSTASRPWISRYDPTIAFIASDAWRLTPVNVTNASSMGMTSFFIGPLLPST